MFNFIINGVIDDDGDNYSISGESSSLDNSGGYMNTGRGNVGDRIYATSVPVSVPMYRPTERGFFENRSYEDSVRTFLLENEVDIIYIQSFSSGIDRLLKMQNRPFKALIFSDHHYIML